MKFKVYSNIFMFLALGAASSLYAADPMARSEHNLVVAQSGDLPIILTAPHGGQEWIPGVPKRRGEGVVTVLDGYTYELTHMLADEMYKLTGRKPYMVAAQFTRKNIDANRPADEAYNSNYPQAKKCYDTYHNKVAEYVHEVKQRWGHGLLLDIHAHGAKRDTIYRGTNRQKTIQSLLERCGQEALTGPNGIQGQLENKGYKVFPPYIGQDEDCRFSGGYTVRRYGSSRSGGIDALQLELGALHRYDKPKTFSKDLAKIIKNFAETYLPVNASSHASPSASQVAHTITNARKERRIAILAYGKLVKNKADIREDAFSLSEVTLPIRLSRISFAGTQDRRLSLAIDPSASGEKVYYATSEITYLPDARHNLAQHVGLKSRDNIAYIRKLKGNQQAEDTESFNAYGWAGSPHQLPSDYVVELLSWAEQKEYDAVMWFSAAPTIDTESGPYGGRKVLSLLKDDKELYDNTRTYIKRLPQSIKTPLLKRIEQGNF